LILCRIYHLRDLFYGLHRVGPTPRDTKDQSHTVKSNAKLLQHRTVVDHLNAVNTALLRANLFALKFGILPSHSLPQDITSNASNTITTPSSNTKLRKIHTIASTIPRHIHSTTIAMFRRLSERLSGDKPEPKPYYFSRMNPQELQIWEIIVSISTSSPPANSFS
jgi:hypothetical protein